MRVKLPGSPGFRDRFYDENDHLGLKTRRIISIWKLIRSLQFNNLGQLWVGTHGLIFFHNGSSFFAQLATRPSGLTPSEPLRSPLPAHRGRLLQALLGNFRRGAPAQGPPPACVAPEARGAAARHRQPGNNNSEKRSRARSAHPTRGAARGSVFLRGSWQVVLVCCAGRLCW